MYHANAFPVLRSEPIPVYSYVPAIDPKPVNKPQTYQILGGLARRITKSERFAVIQSQLSIQSIQNPISSLSGHSYEIPEVGRFRVDLVEAGYRDVTVNHFENYVHLVNRLVDVALTLFAEDYYKFHPDAPYILRDEPYFDQDLISKTGILDAKRYYRGVHMFNNTPSLVLNRETQLRSNGSLLSEIRSMKTYFEEVRGEEVDLDSPSQSFVDFVNSLLRGKSADVKRYPGPAVRRIKEVTWRYRAKDTTPGSSVSQLEYFRTTYGITGLDPIQPLVTYDVENLAETRYHIPELLSVGHDFHDLERRIPKWRREQVWGILHPDCKNQLAKIFEVLTKVDEVLREHVPEIYPNVVEIAREPLDVSDFASRVPELKLLFGNKEIVVKHPFDISFYHQYSKKRVTFARAIPSTRMLVLTDLDSRKIRDFIVALQSEFELRNGSQLGVDFSTLKSGGTDFSKHDLILTLGAELRDEDDDYKKHKESIQNKAKVPHQHVTESHADKDSVMQLVMQLTLKLGGDPWLLPSSQIANSIFGVHSYLNPETEKATVFGLVLNGDGSLRRQFEPIDPSEFGKLARELVELNKKEGPSVYLFSFDRFGLIPEMKKILASESGELEYCLVHVEDEDHFRFFETWIPKKAPRFGKKREALLKSQVEAFEVAPEGLVVKASKGVYFLATGRTIEKGSLSRGCPTPIRLTIVEERGARWDGEGVAKLVFSLCMMGRASGHLTRFPSPIYYLRSYAHYYRYYGLPEDENLRQRIFHI